jgi:hypothetical protein
VELLAPEDLGAFEVRLDDAVGCEPTRALAIRAAGRPDGSDHVWVAVADLKRWAKSRGEDQAWLDGLARMVAFAHTRGWLTADGMRIRGHVTTGSTT